MFFLTIWFWLTNRLDLVILLHVCIRRQPKIRSHYCVHVNTQLNHSSKYNNPTDRPKICLELHRSTVSVRAAADPTLQNVEKVATNCLIFCNVKQQTNLNVSSTQTRFHLVYLLFFSILHKQQATVYYEP